MSVKIKNSNGTKTVAEMADTLKIAQGSTTVTVPAQSAASGSVDLSCPNYSTVYHAYVFWPGGAPHINHVAYTGTQNLDANSVRVNFMAATTSSGQQTATVWVVLFYK